MSSGSIELWFWSGMTAFVGYALCRRKPWLALFILPATVLTPYLLANVPHSPEIFFPEPASLQVKLAAAAILLSDIVGLIRGDFRFVWFHLYEDLDAGRPPGKADARRADENQ